MVESIPLLPNLTVLKLDIVQTTTEVILSSLVADLQLQACWLTWATSPHDQNSTIVLLHPPIATQLRFLDINTSCPAIGEILASFSFPGDCYLGLLYSGSPPESVLSFARSCMADPFKRPLIDELEVVHDSSVPVNAGDVGFWMVPLHFQFRIDELSEFISVMSALPFQQITKLNLIHGDFMCSKAWVGFLYSFDYVTEVRLSYPSDLLAELLIVEGRRTLFPLLTTLALKHYSKYRYLIKGHPRRPRRAGCPILRFCVADAGGTVDMVEDPCKYERTTDTTDFMAFTYRL
ncbi:hypothetical protein IMY05_C3651001000 [Salix suchowensis]|nr:hypothetical protein IMY05_C3651001000 [Salix suchowensis]